MQNIKIILNANSERRNAGFFFLIRMHFDFYKLLKLYKMRSEFRPKNIEHYIEH